MEPRKYVADDDVTEADVLSCLGESPVLPVAADVVLVGDAGPRTPDAVVY